MWPIKILIYKNPIALVSRFRQLVRNDVKFRQPKQNLSTKPTLLPPIGAPQRHLVYFDRLIIKCGGGLGVNIIHKQIILKTQQHTKQNETVSKEIELTNSQFDLAIEVKSVSEKTLEIRV